MESSATLSRPRYLMAVVEVADDRLEDIDADDRIDVEGGLWARVDEEEVDDRREVSITNGPVFN